MGTRPRGISDLSFTTFATLETLPIDPRKSASWCATARVVGRGAPKAGSATMGVNLCIRQFDSGHRHRFKSLRKHPTQGIAFLFSLQSFSIFRVLAWGAVGFVLLITYYLVTRVISKPQ